MRIQAAATPTNVVVDTSRRTITGTVFRYGELGHTSAGPRRVGRGVPPPPIGLPMTLEHDRGTVRGHVAMVDVSDERLRVACRVADGPEGDAALAEAKSRTRAGFSFDFDATTTVGDEIVTAEWVAIGQVTEPAFNSARIDHIAAAHHNPPEGTTMMLTPEQTARLAALRGQDTLTQDEATELHTLTQLEAAAEEAGATEEAPPAEEQPTTAARRVAASMPAVPSGVPAAGRAATRTQPRVGALDAFLSTIVNGYANSDPRSITAALSDITDSQHSSTVGAPAWSGELWSGLQYEPEYTPLLNSGTLDNYEGKGWRWVVKPEMADYAGDKAAIPSSVPTTEPATYEAARMAVGHDIDRKFYDFPDQAFLASYVEAVRESWAVKLDLKVKTWIEANAVASGTGAGSILKAAARAARAVKTARLGRASFVIISDNDADGLMDVAEADVPAFFAMYGIDPATFVISDTLATGTVIAGVKQAATVRTLPGSPIRVSAQNIANGGIDEGFFGYWAIEEHHTSAIKKVTVA